LSILLDTFVSNFAGFFKSQDENHDIVDHPTVAGRSYILLLIFFAIQTLISQTADRRPVKNRLYKYFGPRYGIKNLI